MSQPIPPPPPVDNTASSTMAQAIVKNPDFIQKILAKINIDLDDLVEQVVEELEARGGIEEIIEMISKDVISQNIMRIVAVELSQRVKPILVQALVEKLAKNM